MGDDGLGDAGIAGGISGGTGISGDASAIGDVGFGGIGFGDVGDSGLGFGFDPSLPEGTGISFGQPDLGNIGFPAISFDSPQSTEESILGKFGKMALNMALSKAFPALNNPVTKGAIGLGKAAVQEPEQGKQTAFNSFMDMGKNTIASAFGPMGMLGMLGLNTALGSPSNQGMTGNASVSGQMGNPGGNNWFDNLAGGLASLYSYNQANRGLKNNINSLEGLYSAGGPYAQQLRANLERRDAARGRRSDYAGREVQLMAELAGRGSQMAPHLNQMQMQRNAMRGQGLGQLLNFGRQSGFNDWAMRGLQGMFSSSQPSLDMGGFDMGSGDFSLGGNDGFQNYDIGMPDFSIPGY